MIKINPHFEDLNDDALRAYVRHLHNQIENHLTNEELVEASQKTHNEANYEDLSAEEFHSKLLKDFEEESISEANNQIND